MKKFYSVKDAAKVLSVSTNTVYKYLEEKKLKAVRFGRGRIKIPVGQLSDYTHHESISTISLKGVSLKSAYQPDIFDWFLSLLAIFLGLVDFIFPLNLQFFEIREYAWLMLFAKILLVTSGVALLGFDIFFKTETRVIRHLIRLPMSFAFLIIASMFFVAHEYTGFTNFFALGLFCFVLPFLNKGAHTMKFLVLAVIILFLGTLGFMASPSPLFFGDIRYFVDQHPVWFAILGIGTSVVVFVLGLIKNKYVMMCLFAFLGIFFFLLSINFIAEQAWNRAIAHFIIAFFAFLMPFHNYFDTLQGYSRREVLVSFLWVIAVMMVGLGLLAYNQATFRGIILNESKRSTETGVQLISSYVEESVKFLSGFGEDDDLLSLLATSKNEDELTAFARSIYLSSSTFRRIGIIGSDGVVIADYPPSGQKADISDRDYYIRAKQAKTTIVSNANIPANSQFSIGIYVHMPLYDQKNNFIGMLGASLDLAKLSNKLAALEFGEKGYFVVADREGTIFIHKDPSLLGKKAERNKAIIAAVSGKHGVTDGYSEKGEFVLQTYAPVAVVDWGIVAQQDYAEAFKRSSLISFCIFLASTAAGIGTLMSAIYLANRKKVS